jgi:hypothetical protein
MKKSFLFPLVLFFFVVSTPFLISSCAGTPSKDNAHPEISGKKPKCSPCHEDMATLDHDQKLWGEGHATLIGDKKDTCTLCHNIDTCGMCHSN